MLAIVLKRRDFREADQITSLYTKEQGKLELLARGIKKITSKHSGNLLPGALVDIEIAQGKEIDYLTKVHPVSIFKDIRNDLSKSLIVGHAVSLVDRVVGVAEKDEKVFGLLEDFLSFINKVDKVKSGLFYSFIVLLLSFLGFRPELDRCVKCGLDESMGIGFDIKSGGLLCEKCIDLDNELVKLNKNQIEYFKILLIGDWEEIVKLEDNKKVFDLIFKFIQFYSEKKLTKFNHNLFKSV